MTLAKWHIDPGDLAVCWSIDPGDSQAASSACRDLQGRRGGISASLCRSRPPPVSPLALIGDAGEGVDVIVCHAGLVLAFLLPVVSARLPPPGIRARVRTLASRGGGPRGGPGVAAAAVSRRCGQISYES